MSTPEDALAVKIAYDALCGYTVHKKAEQLADILAESFVATDMNGRSLDKPGFLAAVEAGELSGYALKPDRTKAKIGDDFASVSGKVRVAMHETDEEEDAKEFFLDVKMTKDAEKWLVTEATVSAK